MQQEEDDDEDEDGGDEQYTVQSILDSRIGRLTKKVEYLVSWHGYDESHNSWEPEANLSGAKEMLLIFKAERAAKDKEAAEEKRLEEARELLKKQERLVEGWKAAVEPVRQLVKERFQLLEGPGDGNRVQVMETAPNELVEELHAELLSLDPAYDRNLRSMTQLKKMPILNELLGDEAHCTSSLMYCFETKYCGKPACDCKFNCKPWTLSDGSEVPSQLMDTCLKSMPMPMHGKDPKHFLPFAEADALPATTEEHFPSRAGKTETLAMKELAEVQKERKELDKGKSFNTSKVRDVINCAECGRWRVIYSEEKASRDQLAALVAYKESVIWSCGAGLFVAEPDEGSAEAMLASKFYVRTQNTCRDPMELNFYNYGNTRGREVFDDVCSICGCEPDESPFVAESELVTGGKKALPLCQGCHEKGANPLTHGAADQLKKKAEEASEKEAKRQKRQKDEEERQRQRQQPRARSQPPQSAPAQVQPPSRRRRPSAMPPPPKKAKKPLLTCKGLILKVLEAEPAGLPRDALVAAMRGAQDTMFVRPEVTSALESLKAEARVVEMGGKFSLGGTAGAGRMVSSIPFGHSPPHSNHTGALFPP